MVKSAFNSKVAHLLSVNKFTILVDDLATLDPTSIKLLGVHSTGFKDADRELSGIKSTVMTNILTLLNYEMSGIDIEFVYDKDVIEIHRIITQYLQEWEHHISTSFNVRVTEYEDFLKSLSSFNDGIYSLISTSELKALDKVGDDPKQPRLRPLGYKDGYVKEDYDVRYGNIFDVINRRIDEEN